VGKKSRKLRGVQGARNLRSETDVPGACYKDRYLTPRNSTSTGSIEAVEIPRCMLYPDLYVDKI
jgi:hypothetical protein